VTRFPAFPEEYRKRNVEAGLWLDRTLHDVFDEAVSAGPETEILIAGDRRITFREWKEESDAIAAGLHLLGIGRGDIVSVGLPNWPEMCFLQIALSRIGAVIQPLHVVYREREIESMLCFCESAAVVVPESFGSFAHADAIRALRPRLPDLRLLVVARPENPVAAEGEAALEDVAAGGRGHPEALEGVSVDPDDVFYLNFTSGTEGTPKGFLHTHNTLIALFKRFADLAARYGKGGEKRAVTLANSPLTHSYGHFSVYQTILAATPMVLVDRYRPLDVLKIIEREKVASLTGTPAHVIGLINHPDFATYDTSSVRSVGLGGARAPADLADAIRRIWKVPSGNTYGMGENVVHTRTSPKDSPEKIAETVGRPVPGAEVCIFAEDRLAEMKTGEVGEIAYRGPSLFVGYFKNEEMTRATRNGEGWFFTGDLGFLDEEGYLHLAGRKKEIINRGGVKIFPKEIEDLIATHPKVREAAVVGYPDYRLGERVCAVAVAAAGEPPTLDEIVRHLEGKQIMKHKLPEKLIIMDALPMTPTGKVMRSALEEEVRRRIEGAGSTGRS
jgi:acyl-CoA synthetase (AMP-forming)/AMP-acid ligase II